MILIIFLERYTEIERENRILLWGALADQSPQACRNASFQICPFKSLKGGLFVVSLHKLGVLRQMVHFIGKNCRLGVLLCNSAVDRPTG